MLLFAAAYLAGNASFLPWDEIRAVGFYVGDISERIKKVAKTYQKEKVRREGKDEEVQQQ